MPAIEHCTSYGRGGAVNLRRQSETKMAEEILRNSPPDERRRSSVWSTSGSNSRRTSIVDALTGVFRKNSKVDFEDLKQ